MTIEHIYLLYIQLSGALLLYIYSVCQPTITQSAKTEGWSLKHAAAEDSLGRARLKESNPSRRWCLFKQETCIEPSFCIRAGGRHRFPPIRRKQKRGVISLQRARDQQGKPQTDDQGTTLLFKPWKGHEESQLQESRTIARTTSHQSSILIFQQHQYLTLFKQLVAFSAMCIYLSVEA